MSNELTARGAPAQDLASLLTRFITDENVTSDKLDAVLRMRRELVDEERREQYQEAFARLQAELPVVPRNGMVKLKNRDGSEGKYNFGKYEDMMAALQPLLSKFGFSVRFTVLPADGGLIVVRCFLERNGYSTHGDSAPIPPDRGPGRNDAQAAGSSTTYGKRYALVNVLNIVFRGADDDGVKGGNLPLTDEHLEEITALLDASGADVEKFLKFAGVTELHDIPERNFVELKAAIHEASRIRKRKAPK